MRTNRPTHAAKSRCVATIAGHHTRPIYDVSWSKVSGLIASAGGDNTIKIFAEVCELH